MYGDCALRHDRQRLCSRIPSAGIGVFDALSQPVVNGLLNPETWSRIFLPALRLQDFVKKGDGDAVMVLRRLSCRPLGNLKNTECYRAFLSAPLDTLAEAQRHPATGRILLC